MFVKANLVLNAARDCGEGGELVSSHFTVNARQVAQQC